MCAELMQMIMQNNRFEEQVKYLKNNSKFLSSNCEVIENKNLSYVHKTDIDKVYTNPIVHPTIIVKTEILKNFYIEKFHLLKIMSYIKDYFTLDKLDNIHKNLIKYNRILKILKITKSILRNFINYNNFKCFRNNNIVNHNFKRINLEKILDIVMTSMLKTIYLIKNL